MWETLARRTGSGTLDQFLLGVGYIKYPIVPVSLRPVLWGFANWNRE
jgi:hypothetical protein